MYITTLAEVQSLLDGVQFNKAGCCGGAPTDALDTFLRNMRTRVESALNIESLERYTWRDTFEIDRCHSGRPVSLRLTNAFINEPESVKITTRNGTELFPGVPDPDAHWADEVDCRLGVVHLGSATSGIVKVEYVSGFEVDDDKVFTKTPDWMHTVALAALRTWMLGAQKVAGTDQVALRDMAAQANRELMVRIYERYDRPRGSVLWPIRDVVAVGPAAPATDSVRYKGW